MTAASCPFPGCEKPLPSRDSAFCADHHFACEPFEARMLVRLKVELRRTADAEERRHLAGQLAGYTNTIIRHIQERQKGGQTRVA